jgi:hypothetical protein
MHRGRSSPVTFRPDGLGRRRSQLGLPPAAEAGDQLLLSGKFGDATEFGEQKVSERFAGQGSSGLECGVHRIGHVSNLDHGTHVHSMKTCAEHVNRSKLLCLPHGGEQIRAVVGYFAAPAFTGVDSISKVALLPPLVTVCFSGVLL